MKIYKYNCTKTCISQDYRQPYITMLIYWISVDFAIQIFIFYEVCVLTKKVWGKQQNVFTGSCVLHIFDTGLVYTKIARKRKKKKKTPTLLSLLLQLNSQQATSRTMRPHFRPVVSKLSRTVCSSHCILPTCDQAGNNKRQNEHLQHPH